MLRQMIRTLKEARTHRQIKLATRHLEPHLLRDIGLVDPKLSERRLPLVLAPQPL
jgi:hypothetical protein